MPRQQLQPGILQAVGVLKLIDENMSEALLIVVTQGLVALQHFVGAQQQFGKVDHPFALALRIVFGIKLNAAPGVVIISLSLRGAYALLLVCIDKTRQFSRRELDIIHIEVLQQALDSRELIGRVENLEQRRQTGITVMCSQQPVAQPVKSADPHAAYIDRQHRGQARQHFLRRLVGESHGENTVRPGLSG